MPLCKACFSGHQGSLKHLTTSHFIHFGICSSVTAVRFSINSILFMDTNATTSSAVASAAMYRLITNPLLSRRQSFHFHRLPFTERYCIEDAIQFFLPHNRDSNTSIYSFNHKTIINPRNRLLCTSNPPQAHVTTLRFRYELFLPCNCGGFPSVLFSISFIMLNFKYKNPYHWFGFKWASCSALSRSEPWHLCWALYTSFAGYNIIIGSIKPKPVLLSFSLLHRWLNPW